VSRIGILAAQGAFERHADLLTQLGHQAVFVRASADFRALDGLVLPGGESSVQLQLIERLELRAPLDAFLASEKPVLATCAGLILLARTVSRPEQPSLARLDVAVTRNAWGRQLDSFEARSDGLEPLPLVFIRAPRIDRVGERVEVLASFRDGPVLVREGSITAATFHPELTGDLRVHAGVFGSLQFRQPS
jgi:pyridoxal 5'-phosphate synthase pdxT subunit